MAAEIRDVFAKRKAENRPVFVTFLTASYPRPELTVDLMLACEAGGADIIELGVPFTDPQADGPAIEEANNVALTYKTNLPMCLDYVKQARQHGLKAPVLLMGYYNPLLQYDEHQAVSDSRAAGANGFIIVDLPPEEAVKFRGICTSEGMSYIPLIAPSTSDSRIKFLGGIADSFIYVVSRMGTTGSQASVSEGLPGLLDRIQRHLPSPTPLAVGFGVSTNDHFKDIGSLTDGIVVGSKLVTALKNAAPNTEVQTVQRICETISGGPNRQPRQIAPVQPDKVVSDATAQPPIATQEPTKDTPKQLPQRFGEFGGQYVPEALYDCLIELESIYSTALSDPAFWAEFRSLYGYMSRPSNLYKAERLSEMAGGANIWFKREDLNHTGSHKINNAIGQILLAKRIGKKRIIAETGAGQHGVATATACARFGLECVIYMGAEDVRRQALNVFRIKMLGAQVVAVTSGSKTLKDAVNEAMRDWVTNLSTTHYLIGSAIGPHPFPTLVREFQSVIGSEIKEQLKAETGRLPDAVVACVGGGSNAVGTFHPLVEDASVRLIGCEAGGDGIDTDRHSATLTKGTKGVFHGVRTYVLQTQEGQIIETHSISAGLDYPGVGPYLAFLKDSGRGEFVAVTDEQALRGFRMCTQYEGIIPAMETAHAIWATVELAKSMSKDQHVVMTLSGRGDKDVAELCEILPKWADKIDWHIN